MLGKWLEKYRGGVLKLVITVLIVFDIVWSTGNDKKFFYWDGAFNSNSIIFYCVMKIIYTCIVALLGYLAYQFLLKPSHYLNMAMEWLKYAWPVLMVYLAVMVILWPGNWGAVSDEMAVYLSVKNMRVWPDQGIMSSLFMILCLMAYPAPWMIALTQCIISIIVIGNVIKDITNEFALGGVGKCLLSLLFISMPALCYVTCPIRAWLYTVFLIALIENMYVLTKCGDGDNQKKLLRNIAIMSTLVVNYRNEGMFFIIICIAIIAFFSHLHLSKVRVILSYLAFVCAITAALRGLTLLGNGTTARHHPGLGFVTTLSTILSDDEQYEKIDKEDIDNIDAVFDVEVLREHPSMTFPFDAKMSERDFSEPTQEEMSAYMSSVMKIILRNIPTFLMCKWEAAKWSVGVYPYPTTVWSVWPQETIDLWNENTKFPGNMSDDFRKYADDDIRNRFSNRIVHTFNVRSVSSFYIFYAFWLPCLLLPVMAILNGVMRNGVGAFMCVGICMQLVAVIIMAPARYQMYYLPFYFLGWLEVLRFASMVFGEKVDKIL